jgi:hypothetical protein
MNEIQATKLSTFIVEHFNNRLLIYNDGVDCWEIDNDKSNCDFWIAYNEFTDGSLQIGVNMKFAYNKFSDCPIVCEFPETEEEWKVLMMAMQKLMNDCYPEKIHDFGSYYEYMKR